MDLGTSPQIDWGIMGSIRREILEESESADVYTTAGRGEAYDLV
jgi:hypothetical protein